jgi:K+-sensing histidine kinase KdpD
MGLAIVRGIVEAHGGRAWLEPPTPGRGAMFSIALSIAPAARLSLTADGAAARSARSAGRFARAPR